MGVNACQLAVCEFINCFGLALIEPQGQQRGAILDCADVLEATGVQAGTDDCSQCVQDFLDTVEQLRQQPPSNANRIALITAGFDLISCVFCGD